MTNTGWYDEVADYAGMTHEEIKQRIAYPRDYATDALATAGIWAEEHNFPLLDTTLNRCVRRRLAAKKL